MVYDILDPRNNAYSVTQSTLRRPEVCTFAWKIGIYMARMGVNDMRGARDHQQDRQQVQYCNFRQKLFHSLSQ